MFKYIFKKIITVLLIVLMIMQYLPLAVRGEYLYEERTGTNNTAGSSITTNISGDEIESLNLKNDILESYNVNNDVDGDSNTPNQSSDTNNQNFNLQNNDIEESKSGSISNSIISMSSKLNPSDIVKSNLIIDVTDDLGRSIEGVEFRLVGNESNTKIERTVGGKLVFKDLDKGDYILESISTLDEYKQKSLKYKISVAEDAKITVTDIINSKEVFTSNGRENIVDKNFVFSIGIEKIGVNTYDIPISIKAFNKDIESSIKIYAELSKSFLNISNDVSNASLSFESGKYTLSNINLDSNNSWSGKLSIKLNNSELVDGIDNIDVRKIFENIYVEHEKIKIDASSPLLYKSEPVDNTKLNITLNKDKSLNYRAFRSRELSILPRAYSNTSLPSLREIEERGLLAQPMLSSILERSLESRDTISSDLDYSKGNLIINKIEEGKPEEKLPNALFELRTDNRERIINSKKTDTSGEVRFEGLLPGTYYLREIIAPQGYNIDDTEWKVVVDNNGTTKVFKPASGTSYIENGQSEQADDYDKNYNSYEKKAYIRSRIIDVDYEKGIYTQFIYVNTSGDRYENYDNKRKANPKLELTLPTGTTASGFNSQDTKVEVAKVWASNLNATIATNTTMPVGDYSTSKISMTSDRLTIDFGTDFDYSYNDYGRYAGVVKVTSKFDKNSPNDLSINVNYNAYSISYYNNYYNYENFYHSNVTNTVKRPESVRVKGGYAEIDNELGYINPFKFTVENKKTTDITGKLQIDKTDGKNILPGAEFKLENVDNPTKYRIVTTNDKTTTIENIPPAKYTLREIVAPEGYVPSKEIWDVTVNLYGNTSITKRSDGNSTVDSISTGNGITPTGNTTISKSGKSTLSNINITSMDIGSMPEVNKSSMVPLRMRRISPDTTTVGDTRTSGSNQYTTFDALTPGVYIIESMGVLKDNGIQYRPVVITLEVKKNTYGYEYVIKEGNANITGNSITINLERINPLIGYVNVVNEKNKLIVKKVDFNSRVTPLEDAVFELYKEDISNINGEMIKNKVSTGIKMSSSKNGTLEFEGLNSTNVYWLKETVPPIGYKIETEVDGSDKYYGPFVIDKSGIVRNGIEKNSQPVEQPYIISNKKLDPRDGKVVIEKQNSDGTSLSGAEFTIYSADDQWNKIKPLEPTNYKLNIDSTHGIFTFTGLKEGKYIIRETKAPDGYILSNTEMRVQVMKSGETKIINRDAFNSKVSELANESNVNLVSMTEENSFSSESAINPVVSMFTNAARLISGEIGGGTESYVAMTLNSNLNLMDMRSVENQDSDPMELGQIYTAKTEPTKYNTNTKEGTYPTPTSQAYPTVRNSNIPTNSLYWYDSVYKQPDMNEESGYRPSRNLRVAGVNKYAKEVVGNGVDGEAGKVIDGEYEINLKTEGNLVNPDERVDVMIVYDNSNSMRENNRFKVAKEATTKFIKDVLSYQNNSKGYIKMGLITYASDIFDGERHSLKHINKTQRLPDFSYLDFTDNPDKLIDKLPKYVDRYGNKVDDALVTDDKLWNGTYLFGIPSNLKDLDGYEKLNSFGGTFTSGALKKADEILSDTSKSSKTHKKVVIHVTDGMPTRSLKVKKIENGVATDYEDVDTIIKGNGSNYYLNNPYYLNIRDRNLKEVQDQYGVDGTLINNHGFAAISVADNMMKKNYEIYNLGIELSDSTFTSEIYPRYTTKKQAHDLMKAMSSEGGKGHYYDVSDVKILADTFKDIFRKLPQRTVYKAQVVDPMGEMVDLAIPKGDDWKYGLTKEEDKNRPGTYNYLIYDGTTNGSKSFPAGFNFSLTSSQDILKEDVKIFYNPDTRELKMDNFTLAENDWINLKYRVNLRTTDENYQDNVYYPTNGDTYLQPNKDFNMRWKYPVPSVKGPLKSISVEKEWKDYDGSLIQGTIPIRVKLQSRKTNRQGIVDDWIDSTKVGTTEKMIMELNQSNEWKGKFDNLIAYDKDYSYDYRVVEENVPDGFISNIVLRDSKGFVIDRQEDGIKDGKGSVKITNTKKRDIKVKKSWKPDTAPTENMKVAVHLKVYKGDLNTPLTDEELEKLKLTELVKPRTLSKTTNWETKYTDLPVKTLETASEKSIPLVYRIEEENIPGFEVNYNYNPVDNTSEVINFEIPKLGFKNIENKIEFTKVDENGSPIKGAELNLKFLEQSGELVQANVISDINENKYTFKGLKPGRYELWESKSPDGYLNPNVALAEFSVGEDGVINEPSGKNPVEGDVGTGTDKYLRKYGGIYYIKNYKKNMEFKFQKTEFGAGRITTDTLGVKLYKISSNEDNEGIEVPGIFEDSYDLTEQGKPGFDGFKIEIPTTFESGIYYIKETKTPTGFAQDDKKIFLKVDWNNRTIDEIEYAGNSENIVVKKQLYKFDFNTGSESISILDIVNRRIILPDAGGIGSHIITLFGIGLMLVTTFIYRRKFLVNNHSA